MFFQVVVSSAHVCGVSNCGRTPSTFSTVSTKTSIHVRISLHAHPQRTMTSQVLHTIGNLRSMIRSTQGSLWPSPFRLTTSEQEVRPRSPVNTCSHAPSHSELDIRGALWLSHRGVLWPAEVRLLPLRALSGPEPHRYLSLSAPVGFQPLPKKKTPALLSSGRWSW